MERIFQGDEWDQDPVDQLDEKTRARAVKEAEREGLLFQVKEYYVHHKRQFIVQSVVIAIVAVLLFLAFKDPDMLKVTGGELLGVVLFLAYVGISLQGLQRWCDTRGNNCVIIVTLLMHLFNTATGGLFGFILFYFVPRPTRGRAKFQSDILDAQDDDDFFERRSKTDQRYLPEET